MEVVIKIKTCNDCRHRDHTGGFTPGGAKPCCDHPFAVENMDKGNGPFDRVIPYRNESPDNRNVFHKHTFKAVYKPIRTPKGIPKWCPIKNGKDY
jgi:hypothetical protein